MITLSTFPHVKYRQLAIYLQFQWTRIANDGILSITKRLLRKIGCMLLSVFFLPISLVLFLLGYRRLIIFTDRIGHLAIEPDTLLKAQSLGLIQSQRWFILAPKHRVANQHLLSYWKAHFVIFHSTIGCFFLHCLSLWPFMRYNTSHFINNSNGPQLAYRVNALWHNKQPILQLTQADKIWSDEQLIMLGIPQAAWFVCVHAREGGFSPIDEPLHSHRNSHIHHLIPSMEEITRRGGWVIRLGDPTTQPLTPRPQVIDYAHHPLRTERLDVLLCARARFILGNTSGIFLVGSIFGVPAALTNMIPMPMLGLLSQDISIPKLYLSKKQSSYFSFTDIMNSPMSHFRYAALFKEKNIVIEENSCEDILALTTEMLDRLAGKLIESEEDKKRHAKYMSLFKPTHYAYGACSKISMRFLRHYQHLLA